LTDQLRSGARWLDSGIEDDEYGMGFWGRLGRLWISLIYQFPHHDMVQYTGDVQSCVAWGEDVA
jgi:hypothetical protein